MECAGRVYNAVYDLQGSQVLLHLEFVVKRSQCEISVQVKVTPLQRRTQVRFWIQFKIPTEYVKLMPRLPENAKIKIPQVGTYFTL